METEISKSNLLPLVKSFNLMETLPKILNVDKENFKITPSEFIKEMSYTTEERHKKLVNAAIAIKNEDNKYPPQFRVIPNMVVFQGFEARATYCLTLQIRNIGKNISQLKMHCPQSIYFSAQGVGLPANKLASGLSVEYEITFTPKEAKDYFHELIFKSKEDTFQVPIIAIGPRPLLDIPDHVILEPTPAKIGITKSIIVRNIGKVPAVFNFINQSLFRITPSKGILGVHDSMELDIYFESPKVGEVSECIYLVFETGEKLTVTLHGSAENVTVRLDKNSVVHDDTYIGLKRCKSVRLFNNSSNMLKFVWRKHKTEEEDLELLEKLKERCEELHQMEILKNTIPVYYGLSTPDTHKLSSQRLLKDDLQLLEKEEFIFSHEAFSIMPMSGEIWPRNFMDMIISFEPKVCGFASTEAYLDIMGRDSRLPLRIKGNGIGPQIIFNVQTLDTDFIYLCSAHNYEVIASNKSDIPGWLEYVTKDLVFGGKVEITPGSRHLNPGECGVFVISFTSNRSGEFTEKLIFKIKESGEKLTIILKGKVVSPVLHFNTRLIDFGTVPVGFPTVRETTLSNLSVVPVTFSLRVLSDGENPSLSYEQFAAFNIKPHIPQSPKEFNIEPQEGVVEPFSHKKVTLTLTANKTGRFDPYLMVDLWDSENGSLGCPLSFSSKIANIIAEPELISVPFCYLNFPYTRTITLRNLSKVAGFFYLVPMHPGSESPITCSVNIPQGVLEPKGFIRIDITFMTNTVGRHSVPVQLLVFGNNEPSEVCILSCMGQGPVVMVSSNSLNWPDLPLLETSQKKVTLANESPIPATLNIYLVKPNSWWSTNLSNYTLLPEEVKELEVSVTLCDRGKFRDILRIDVHNGKESKIYLSAVGVGSSLKITPNIWPKYDLDVLFSNKVYQYEITIENKGSKAYGLTCSPFPEYKKFSNLKYINPIDLVFKFEPPKIDIQPGEIKQVNLEVYSSSTGLFNQTFYCFANIGGPHKELLMTCEVFAKFVEPLVKIDKTEMRFWRNMGSEEIEEKLEGEKKATTTTKLISDEVEITNFSVLPISIIASVEHPFCFLIEDVESSDDLEVELNGYEIKKINIKFVAEANKAKYSLQFINNLIITFKQHSKKSLVELIGEINYPNVLILPTNISFDHVPMDTNDYKEISLVNTSPLDVYYEIVWNSQNSTFSNPEKSNLLWRKTARDFDEELVKPEEEAETDVPLGSQNEEYEETIDEPLDTPQNISPPVKPVVKMPEIEISKDDIKGMLFPLTRNHHNFEDELLEAYAVARSSSLVNVPSPSDFAKVCDITPFYGKLEKFSSQILTVRLFAHGPLSLHLEALLKIKSGPTEVITINANINKICFQLDKTEFDFGKQLFCKTKCEKLKIQNTGLVSFSYEARVKKDLPCDLNGDLQTKEVITITPAKGKIKSFGEAELLIQYYPGLPGNFESKIQLQIGHLNPITLRIKAFGVFPQVSFNLPRPHISDITPEIGYLAVASITSDWCLRALNPEEMKNMSSVKPYRSEETNFLNSLQKFGWDFSLDEWEYIEDTEFYPFDTDIQLAIERMIAYGQVYESLSASPAFGVYARTLPNFCVPAYEMDFGLAVIGRILEYNAKVTNYGPLPAVMYVVSTPQMKDAGIHVRLKNRNELKVGDCLPFVVYFAPKKTKYKKRFEKIKTFFYFEIYHGPKIPIKVVANVIYPHVIPSMFTLNYSDVQCGCCKVMNLKLKNPGLVTAYWSLVFMTKSQQLNQLFALGVQDGTSMFHLNYNSGILSPNEYCTIQITFKPVLGGVFAAALKIQVVESLEETKVMLFGEGLEPKLKVTDDFIRFESTLPYPNKLEKNFVVENPCSFPIEFYLSTFDEQIFEEDKIIRAVCTYYQTNDILLPVRKPGDGLPIELVNFYHMLLDDLNAKFIEQEKEKVEYEENVSSALSGDDNPIVSSSQVSFVDKKRRKVKKSFSRSRTSMENSRNFNSTSESGKDLSIYSIFEKKTAVEVEELLHDYIKNYILSEPSYDPIQAALKSVLPPVQEEEYKEGTLIIFHGAPFTNFVQMANRSALITGLQTYSIDRIVLEEAVLGRCEAGLTVKELIENAYRDYIEPKEDRIESEMGESAKSDSNNQIDFDVELEEIERKLNALVTLRENLIATKAKGPTTPVPKSGDSKKIEIGTSSFFKPMNLSAPIANITEELVAEILKYRLPQETVQGVIIESFFSLFISSYIKALTIILKAAGNLKDILVVILLQTYSQYTRHILNIQTEEDNEKVQARQELLRILDEEPEYVFKSLELDEQEAGEIRSTFLFQRRESQNIFERQKEFFYENEKLKREAMKKGLRLSSFNYIKADSADDKAQKDKKDKDKKKDGGKNNKGNEVAGQKEGSVSKSAKSGKDWMEMEFSVFENDLADMTALINNWDQRIGGPVVDTTLEVKPKRGVTPRKMETNIVNKANTGRGIFTWLVDVSRPESNGFDGVCHYLRSLLQSKIVTESDSWPLQSTESMTFSVVSYPPLRTKELISENFILTPIEPVNVTEDTFDDLVDWVPPQSSTSTNAKLNRSASQVSFKSKRKYSGVSRRKIDSRASVDLKNNKSKKLSSAGAVESLVFKSRWILQPGDSIRWRVRYYPTEIGTAEQIYPINVVNWQNSQMIHCSGKCDIPSLDMIPEVVFDCVKSARPLASPYSPAYFRADEAFDFGGIVFVQAEENEERPEKNTYFTLKNKSSLPLELKVITAQDAFGDNGSGLPLIKFEPDRDILQPGESHKMWVSTNCVKLGPVSEVLLFVVKDNPKVEAIKVMYEVVKANLSVEPKLVNFDRILLHRKAVRQVVFTNNQLIPFFITLVGCEDLAPEFSFSNTRGWVLPLKTLTIEIKYSASEAQIISEKPVIVKVFNDLNLHHPVQEFSFCISVEAYDAALDIFFSDITEDHINFGDIRVETNCTKYFNLKNVGKYPLGFRIDVDRKFILESEGDQFLVSPQDGTLSPGKMFPLAVFFKTQNEVSWKRLAVFKVLLVEPYKGDEMIAVIPIEVSVRSFFARYEIKPQPDFNFGHIRTNSLVTGSLLIENKGHFSLSYTIESRREVRDSDVNEETKRSSKPSASSKEKMKKIPATAQTLGPFEISPSSGIVEVGQTATVSISCLPSEVKTYEEKVVVLVDESVPTLKKGTELILSATGCLPSINFFDVKNIFREHFICKEEADFKLPAKTGSYTLYTENNASFSFKNVCVCKTAEARIHLPNNGLIECNVTAHVTCASNDEGSRTSVRKDVSTFEVSPTKLIIEPYSSGTLTLTFRPEVIEIYKGVLTITLDMPSGYDNIVHTFLLWGNGILPQIEITEPNSKLPEGQVVVNFPPTSPGQYSTASIAFSNVGLIDCKVVVELYNNQDGVFTLSPKAGTENMLKMWELNKPIDHTVIVSTSPGRVAKFDVTFKPQELKTFSSEIKLFVVDNPFENLCYKLKGEVFFEEVVIEKIRTAVTFMAGDSNDLKSTIHSSPGQYSLNYGDCYVKKKSKALLRLVNKTEKEYFKFEWEETQNLTVSPSVGHLYPNTYKEILITFYPEEPIELEEVPLICVLNKILFENPPQPSWDSRLIQYQKQSRKESIIPLSSERGDSSPIQNTERNKTTADEPQFELIPESNNILLLNISATADYTRLSCETTRVILRNTFMFQTRIYPLVLENPGNVTLEYKLILKSLTAGPIKKNQHSQIGEKSFLNLERDQNRPRSSAPSYGDSSIRSGSKPKKRLRPRPLTSASLLTMNRDLLQSVLQTETVEERKPITYNPFVLENSCGQILPKEKATCKILFSPMDINEYNVTIGIQVANLHPECCLPEIQVSASSIMPYCHFDIPESDYLENGRRDYCRPGPIGLAPGLPLDPDTKTIEIKVIGVNLTVPIEFHMINPTEDDYTFSWLNVTQIQAGVVPSFHCSTTDGRIQAGRQQLMVFSFVSQNLGITESFWKFCIPKFGVETLFLFVADVREPAVFCLSNHIELKPTFIGSSSSDVLKLVNQEDTPFEFCFLSDSLYSEGRLNVLKVDPVAGKIPPNSEVSVRVTFTGKSGGKVLFNLKCKIKCVKEPISVSVVAMTYVVQPVVVFEDLKNIKHNVDSSVENVIDFGTELSPDCPETITLTFTSISKTSFFYEWMYDKPSLEAHFCKIKFKPKSGHIPSLTRGKCELSIVFSKKSSLVNFPVKLKISRGPTFSFLISASASTPCCEFSFNSYDFGYCFLQEKNICFYEVPIFIRNKDPSDVVLECHLPESSAFSHTPSEAIIPSGAEAVINIHFHPKENIPYSDDLKFTLNGLHEKIINLKGHGTEFKVILTNPDDTTISLGAVRQGKSSSRKFSITNKSLAPVKILVGFSDQLPVDGSYLARPEENLIDLSLGHRLSNIITITPSTVFTIKPQKTYTVNVLYTPQTKTSQFSETVSLQFQEKVEPLCVLTGCCLGPEILLDRYILNFGAVLESCSSVLKLKLINSGSIGARFQWDIDHLEEYAISPASGYCSPGSDVTIEVTFRPNAVANCIKDKVECKLQLSQSEWYPSLFLNLIGDCVTLPDALQTVYFECVVRKTDRKTLVVENMSGTEWQLVPVVSGEYFKGYEALVVPSLSTVEYEVNYCPLTMTEEEEFHEGSVFFRLPNGKGLLYRLMGAALPPDPEDIIAREVPAKTKYVELLKVRNWLQYPQRFKVSINCVSNDNVEDPVWTCTGFENLELPRLAEKEYSLTFFAYKTGYLQFHVVFTNEETKEYMWYDITFNIILGGPLEVITLKSGVRQCCSYELKLENPLETTIQYQLESTSPEIRFRSSVHKVPPEQTKYVKVFFTPTLAKEHTENLIAKCPELGIFVRELRLIGVEAQPEPPRTFETSLGTSQTQEISVPNLSKMNAMLRYKTDSEDFTVNGPTSVNGCQVAVINVTYEPSELGSTSATFTVESEQAGNFVFPLLGFCVKPVAKGPFILRPGLGLSLSFKNVFKTSKEFHISVDNPAFILKTTQEIISPKEEFKISVSLQKFKNLEKMSEYRERGIEPRFPIMGQMVVECLNPYVKWQFYLKGVLDKGTG